MIFQCSAHLDSHQKNIQKTLILGPNFDEKNNEKSIKNIIESYFPFGLYFGCILGPFGRPLGPSWGVLGLQIGRKLVVLGFQGAPKNLQNLIFGGHVSKMLLKRLQKCPQGAPDVEF